MDALLQVAREIDEMHQWLAWLLIITTLDTVLLVIIIWRQR